MINAFNNFITNLLKRLNREVCRRTRVVGVFTDRPSVFGLTGTILLATDASGEVISEIRYTAFGETRYENGVTPTDYRYTGQREEAELGLYYYVARWYDPALGRFTQADTIVPNPGSAKTYDRYAYVYNNPMKYVDPSGHGPCEGAFAGCKVEPWPEDEDEWPEPGSPDEDNLIDAERGYVLLSELMGRNLTEREVLWFIARNEYWSICDNKDNPNPGECRRIGQEGLARNYYEWCGLDGCSYEELIGLITGYQAFFGSSGKVDYEFEDYRVEDILYKSWLYDDENEFRRGGRDALFGYIDDILDVEIASMPENDWIAGKVDGEPWQWYGPTGKIGGTWGNADNDVAIRRYRGLGPGEFFYFLTPAQNDNFKNYLE